MQVESICLQILSATMKIILSGEVPQSMSIELNKKHDKQQTIVTIMALLEHFRARQSPSLKCLLRVHYSQAKVHHEDEGFSEDERENEHTLDKIQISLSHQSKEQTFAELHDLQQKLKQKDLTITELTQKVTVREDNLNNLTVAYVKELQSLREQMQRSAADGSFEFFEVSYFDASQILDTTTRNLLNQRIGSLKDQYERFAQGMMQRFQKLQQTAIKDHTNEAPVATEVRQYEAQLARVLSIDQSPYRLWKCVQDFKGPTYLLDVITNQKAGTGINYNEINRIIQRFNPVQKENVSFKEELQRTLMQTCQEVKKENDTLRQERAHLRIQIQESTLQAESLCKQVELLTQMKMKSLTAELQAQLNSLMTSESILSLKKQVLELKNLCELSSMEIELLKNRVDRQSIEINRLELENQDLIETLGNSKSEAQHLSSRLSLLNSNLKALVYQIDYRMRNIKSMEDINLTKDKNELVKAFFQKLKGLEPTQLVHVAHQLEFQNVTYAVLDAHELSKTRQVSRPTQTQLVAVRDRLEVVSPQRTVSPLEPASEVKVNKETQTDEVSDYVKLKNIQDVTYHFPEVSPLALVTPKTPASRPHKSSGQPSSTPTTPSHSRTQARIRSQSANEPQTHQKHIINQKHMKSIKERVDRLKEIRDLAESFDSNKWGELLSIANIIKQQVAEQQLVTEQQQQIEKPEKEQRPQTQGAGQSDRQKWKAQPAFFTAQRANRKHHEPNLLKFVNLELMRESTQENYRESSRLNYERHMKRLIGSQQIDDLMIPGYAQPKLNLRQKEYRSYRSNKSDKARLTNFTNVFLPLPEQSK